MRIKLGIILLSIFLLSFVVACKSGNNNNDNNLKYPDVEDDLKEDSKGTLKFKVTFIIDEDENFYQEVEENKQCIKPADPIKEGYIFSGWYLNYEIFNFQTAIKKDITLASKWRIQEEGEDISLYFKNSYKNKLKQYKTLKNKKL